MTNHDLEQILLEELGYASSPGFGQPNKEPSTRPIPDVYSTYYVQNIPIAYFARLSDATPSNLHRLYMRVWSQSKVPLLYVILPQEIRVYNGYAEPTEHARELDDSENRLLRHLERLTSIESARQEIRRELSDYSRLNLETGAFWDTPDGQRIHRESRADHRLLRAMDQVRRHLLETNLSNDLAYTLLGRSIFIRYLEDRDILTSDWVSQLTDGVFSSYLDTLSNLDITFQLFKRLSDRFNGDLFPVNTEEERQIIGQGHLDILSSFLKGDDLDTKQQSFWPYDFKYIPIELISGIYDTFLRESQRKKLGAFYTPLPLVDFILEETMPHENTQPDMTLLDPACGSGIFLVRAYQRLVGAWQRRHGTSLTASRLSQILQQSIFGIDIKSEAVRIAAFSLYLAILDYLDNEQVLEENFQFPHLEEKNLFTSDFFSPEMQDLLQQKKFDRVIGNPPWGKNTLTSEAADWLVKNNYKVGSKQIAPAFLLRAPEFCIDDGEMALLAPAKSTILVTSGTHEEFREQFFDNYDVKVIVNFSALVYELFPDSLSPSIAVFYRPQLPSPQSQIVYGVPKSSPLSQRLNAIVLDTTEVKFLDREELLTYPVLWKVALWGTPRDAALIERLKSLPTLQEQAEGLGWKIKEGFIAQRARGEKKEALWLYGMPLVDTNHFRPFIVEAIGTVQDTVFERPRTPEIYQKPLTLIHHSQCKAAFSNKEIAYKNSISGVLGRAGQENLLKWLASYINSPLAKYYHFLTSSRWAVERANPIQKEYEQMPFLIPEQNDSRFRHVVNHFDQITKLLQERDVLYITQHEASIQQHEDAIAELVFDLYDLTLTERQLVHDTIDYTIDFFYWGKQKRRRPRGTKAVQAPDMDMLVAYAKTFVETATVLLRYQDQTLNAVVYQNGAPLSVVGFEKVGLQDVQDVKVISDRSDLRNILRELDGQLLEQRNSTLYMRRHVRVYDGPWLYLVRPSEQRFWTRSQALTDVDDAMTEWLSHPSNVVGVPR